MIGGEGIVVEIDGSKFGWRKYNRGHRVDGVWMFDKTHERRIVLLRFKKRDKLTLSTFVTKGSVIHTDKSKSCSGLISLRYKHYTVNYSKNFKDTEIGTHTNTFGKSWCAIKRTILARKRIIILSNLTLKSLHFKTFYRKKILNFY